MDFVPHSFLEVQIHNFDILICVLLSFLYLNEFCDKQSVVDAIPLIPEKQTITIVVPKNVFTFVFVSSFTNQSSVNNG